MTYIPEHVTQEDGSPSQWFNCWAAVGAWLTDGASRGASTPTPSLFRRWARKPPRTTGGMADVVRGLARKGHWERCRALYDVPRAEMLDRFKMPTGTLYGAESDFNAWPEDQRCSPTFGDQDDAYHFIGIIAGEGQGPNIGRVRVMDPLCKVYRWVEVGDVIRAIVTYNNEHAGETRGTADLIACRPPAATVPEHDHAAVIAALEEALELLKEEA